MRQNVCVTVAVIAILFWVGASAASSAEKFEPGVPYYFENFDPTLRPWNPGQGLNIEEVFKNYLYYEVIFDQPGREVTVNRYIQNRKERSDNYRIGKDGGLELK